MNKLKPISVAAAVLILAVFVFPQSAEILKLKEQIIVLQNQGTLGFQNVALCSEILGFGSYVALPEPVVSSTGKIFIYYEPVNLFTVKKTGSYEVWYTQDLTMLDAAGTVLQEWKGFLEFHYSATSPVLDTYAQNSIDLGGQIPPGKYQLRMNLQDKLGKKTAVRTLAVEVVK